MKINRHNLTIVTHCAAKSLQGTVTNALQFTKSGTMAVNGAYSVAVTALAADDKEPYPGCITPADAEALLVDIPAEGKDIRLAGLKFIDGFPPVVKWPEPEKEPAFEIFINADFLLKLAQSVCDFTQPRVKDEDAVVRIQFTSQKEPVRMDARNSLGQKWEALLMPRKPHIDAEPFYKHGAIRGERQAIPVPPPPDATPEDAHHEAHKMEEFAVPPPPVEESEFEAALRLAASL